MKIKTAAEVFGEVLAAKKAPRIKLLGDSITHGVGGDGWEQKGEVIVKGWAQSPDSYCWANSLRDYMKEKYGANVVNKACTGTNVEFILEHFDELVDTDDDLIVCMIGTNNRNGDRSVRPRSHVHVLFRKMHDIFLPCQQKRKPRRMRTALSLDLSPC